MKIELNPPSLHRHRGRLPRPGRLRRPARLPRRCGNAPGRVLGPLLAAKESPAVVGDTTPLLGLGDSQAGSGPRLRTRPARPLRRRRRVLGRGRRRQAARGQAAGVGRRGRSRVGAQPEAIASALVEGLIVGTPGPGPAQERAHPPSLCDPADRPPARGRRQHALEQAVRRGQIVGEAINLARDLVNTPPSEKTPDRLAERIAASSPPTPGSRPRSGTWHRIRRRAAGRNPGRRRRLRRAARRSSCLAYRKGGDRPDPRPGRQGSDVRLGGPLAQAVGVDGRHEVRHDRRRGRGRRRIQALARLELPVNVVGLRRPDREHDRRPGDEARRRPHHPQRQDRRGPEHRRRGPAHPGRRPEPAVEEKPRRILDLATLTGACMVALGPKVAGLFSNDDAFSQDVLAACRTTGERAWRLPLDDDYKEQLKSNVADLKNVGGKHGRGDHGRQVPRAVRRRRPPGSTSTSPDRAGPTPTPPPATRAEPAASCARLVDLIESMLGAQLR